VTSTAGSKKSNFYYTRYTLSGVTSEWLMPISSALRHDPHFKFAAMVSQDNVSQEIWSALDLNVS